MSLMNTLKTDQMLARKERKSFVVSSLTTLIGEAEMIGKNDGNRETTDAEVIRTVKKFISNLRELQTTIIGNTPKHELTNEQNVRLAAVEFELELYEKYLPKQLSEAELRAEIEAIKAQLSAGPKDVGKVMGLLKEKFAGLYDGKLASAIVKEVLQ
jgi:uncharacterized protein YqeY